MSGRGAKGDAVRTDREFTRRIGHYRGTVSGPCVVSLGGIHGNEPAGVYAQKRVLAKLAEWQPDFRGDFIAVAGNLTALHHRQRYLDEDLNRVWRPARVERLHDSRPRRAHVEWNEQRELHEVLHDAFDSARGPVHFMDLHTSSAEGVPFACIGDSLRNRSFALKFPVPVILGLEEQVDGALLEYVNNLGYTTIGIEAGQHDAPESVDFHEACLWLGLFHAGCVREQDVPQVRGLIDKLRRKTAELPRCIAVRYRHGIRPEDEFVMEPGFENFDRIKSGKLLARDRNGEIHAREHGRMLLPLYQGHGDDGFFIAREFSTFWLRLSRIMRRMKLHRMMSLLPGVRRHPQDPETLQVNTRVARFYSLELFHLLGYRKRRRQGEILLVTRRVGD